MNFTALAAAIALSACVLGFVPAVAQDMAAVQFNYPTPELAEINQG